MENVADLICRGTHLLMAGKPADAVEPLREALRLLPTDGSTFCRLAQAYSDLGRCDEAVQAWEYAILHLDVAERDWRALAFQGLTQSYRDAGRPWRAIALEEKIGEAEDQA